MFTSLYFYRVPKKNVELFLNIQKKSSEIYKKYGAIEDWTFGPDNLNEKYGCTSFLQQILNTLIIKILLVMRLVMLVGNLRWEKV
jgi:hypothetical protein